MDRANNKTGINVALTLFECVESRVTSINSQATSIHEVYNIKKPRHEMTVSLLSDGQSRIGVDLNFKLFADSIIPKHKLEESGIDHRLELINATLLIGFYGEGLEESIVERDGQIWIEFDYCDLILGFAIPYAQGYIKSLMNTTEILRNSIMPIIPVYMALEQNEKLSNDEKYVLIDRSIPFIKAE